MQVDVAIVTWKTGQRASAFVVLCSSLHNKKGGNKLQLSYKHIFRFDRNIIILCK